MGRLTGNDKGEGFIVGYESDLYSEICEDNDSCKGCIIHKLIQKLKAYEDIIDDPEKLKEIDVFYRDRCEEINELRKRVALYKEMISNGILRVMPCKLGDKAYHVIYDKCAEPQIYISEHVITDVSERAVYFADDWWNFDEMYDNNVFLDKEKAQEALERMKEVHDVKC